MSSRGPSSFELAGIRERLGRRVAARRGASAVSVGTPRDLLVCAGGGCLASRSGQVVEALEREISLAGLEQQATVVRVGCMGLCEEGPLVLVSPDGVLYRGVDGAGARAIVREHLEQGRPVADLELTWQDGDGPVRRGREVPFFARQRRIVLRNCGVIDPLDLDEFIAAEGYVALEQALFESTPERVLDTLHRAGLRGRGGAGFPVGLKWQAVREAEADEKLVVCNADDGDPGTFVARSLLAGDPYSLIEAMTLAGWVVGSRRGYVYVRAEYPLAIERLGRAIEQARRRGLLGSEILGSDLSFDLEVSIGPGAFVCGEETALIQSIEGRRGTPRPRPPFPAERGLWRKPTLINNVETLANVPPIVRRGAAWYAATGSERSKGTKLLALAGNVRNTGLVEVPMGTPLREVVETIGGGTRSGLAFKAVQCGGPAGGAIPAARADVPVDFEPLAELGAIMGSGGLIVVDESACMVELARYYLDFLADESCGKCPPCRIGTRVLLNVVERMTRGAARLEDLEILESLGKHVQRTSLCGLGRTAPNGILATLRHFPLEVRAHLEARRCPAGRCVTGG